LEVKAATGFDLTKIDLLIESAQAPKLLMSLMV
jgi:hypothetical protein